MSNVRIALTTPQHRFVASESQFPCFCGGYGSGKSQALVIRALVKKLAYPQQSVAYYMPTFDLCRVIGFPRVCEQLETLGLPFDLNKSFATIDIPDAGQIVFRTLDSPERIIGFEVADSFVDELDTLPIVKAREVWNKIVARNRQKKPDGSVNSVGVGSTPEGFGFIYDRWKRNPAPGYELIRASTYTNARNLPEGYIESLKNTYPPHLLSAYLDGEFVNLTAGSVYPEFDRTANHTSAKLEPGEAIHVGMDFNVMNMTAIVSVVRDNLPITVDELTGIRDTPAMCESLRSRYPGRSIAVYPDASGRGRHSVDAMQSDMTILKQAGFTIRVAASNPSIRDRVNAVNAIIPKWKVNTDACPRLTECIEQQAYDKNGDPDKSGGLDHAPDAFGYFIAQRFPIVKRNVVVEPLRI